MTLASQTLSVPFAGGLDQKTAAQLVASGKQTQVTNGVFTKNGSIRKRQGTTQLGSVTNLAGNRSCPRLLTFRDELVAIDGQRLLTYSPTATAFTVIDDVSEVTCTRYGVQNAVGGIANYDCATIGTVMLQVFQGDLAGLGTQQVYAQLVDTVSGAVIKPIAQLVGTDALNPRALALGDGDTFVVTWTDNAGAPATIYATTMKLSTYTLGWPAGTAIGTGGATPGVYDAQPISGSTSFALAFEANGGAGGLVVAYLNPSLVLGVNTTKATAAPGMTCIGLCATTGENFFVAYSNIAGVASQIRVLPMLTSNQSTTAAGITNPFNFAQQQVCSRIGLARVAANKAIVAAGAIPNAVAPNTDLAARTQWIQTHATTGTVGVVHGTRHVLLHGRPFMQGTSAYCTVIYSGETQDQAIPTTQGTAWLLDLVISDTTTGGLGGRPVCTIAPATCTDIKNRKTVLTTSIVPYRTAIGQAVTKYVALVSVATRAGHQGISACVLDFANAGTWTGAELGPNLNISGGVPSLYDGQIVSEIGFLYYPETTAGLSLVNAAAGGLSAGTYSYRYLYEWYDAQGQRHQSAPSSAMAITLAANRQTTLKIPCLNLTTRTDASSFGSANIALVPYRTVADGTTYFRIPTQNVPTTLLNNYTAESTTYADNLTDAALTDGTHEILYTQGDASPSNVCPGSASLAVIYKGRLVLAGSDDPRLVWMSSAFQGGDAVAFALSVVFTVDEDVTALAVLDDKLVLFSSKSVYIVTGDGPSLAGTGSDLSAPQRVTSDVGCVEPRSIVRLTDGLLFQSAGGIYKLSRALEVTYLGSPVEDALTANPTITSAVLLDSEAQQRLSASASATGVALVYDDLQSQWSTFSYTGTTGTASTPIDTAVKWKGTYVFASSGYVYQESATSNLDDFGVTNRWVTRTVESSWFKPSGVQGFGRFWYVGLEGEYVSPHNLTISIASDYENAYGQVATWTSTEVLASLVATPREQAFVHVARQKVESIRVKVADAAPTGGQAVGSGAGCNLIALDFEIGIKKGTYKGLSAAGAK